MKRTKFVAANWKMQKGIADGGAFATELKLQLDGLPACDMAVFPTFISLPALSQAFSGTRVVTGAQDLFWEREGAYTGEVSGAMIREAGGTSVIVGHSERRHVMGESNEVVAAKLKAALEAGLLPVLCVGEQLPHRDAGEAESFVRDQLGASLSGVTAAEMASTVIAYEPVWAIGTGRTATPDDAEAMHVVIRAAVGERFGGDAADAVRILYGGSVKPGNASDLLARDEIDGALVGGASLQVNSFIEIVRAVGGG